MNIKTAFPSKYLKVDDLGGKSVTLTMDSVDIEEVGQGQDKEKKPILRFRKTEKALVLNVTNSNTIAKLYGDDTEGWSGQRITLVPREVEFQGNPTMAIRVSLTKPAATSTAAPKQAEPEFTPEPPDDVDGPGF